MPQGSSAVRPANGLYLYLFRVSQEERSVFWEVIVSVILSRKV